MDVKNSNTETATTRKAPKMSVVKITAKIIAKKAGVSEDTVESTLQGRRKNKKVIATVNSINKKVEKILK